jgi:hypothetical protein
MALSRRHLAAARAKQVKRRIPVTVHYFKGFVRFAHLTARWRRYDFSD